MGHTIIWIFWVACWVICFEIHIIGVIGSKIFCHSSLAISLEVFEVEDPLAEVKELSKRLDSSRGCLLSSSYEYPGRYKGCKSYYEKFDPALIGSHYLP